MKLSRSHRDIGKAKNLVSPQFFELSETPDESGWFYPTKSPLEVVGYLPETTEALMRNRETGTHHAVIGNVIRQININHADDVTFSEGGARR